MTLVVPETLQEKIRQNKLVPIIGAGVSMSVKNNKSERVFPSWADLLNRASDKLVLEGKKEIATAVSAVVAIGNLLQAATIAQNGLNGALWYDFLKKQFDLDFNELDLESTDLHKALWKLSQRQITLNYDNCMKWAHNQSSNLLVFDNSNRTSLREFKTNNNKNMLWHLHGNIDNPEHIILTPESYHLLYNNIDEESLYKSALVTLRDVISTDSLLFVGCSMSDIELLIEMEKQNTLFRGNTGPHYALVKESEKESIQLKLEKSEVDIQLLCFSEFGAPLVDAINKISIYKNDNVKINDHVIKEKDKVVIYESNPLDKPQCYDNIYRQLKKFKSPMEIKACNTDNLYDDVDYAFILSKWTNNGFLIEDDSACGDYLDLEALADCFPVSVKGVIIITDKISDFFDKKELESIIDIPIIFIEAIACSDKDVKELGQIYHQIFKKGKLNFYKNSLVINESKFNIDITTDEKTKVYRSNETKLKEIDKAIVTDFIGRKSDLASISRELLRIAEKIQVLTVKGSGGVGKTKIIKKLAVELALRGRFSSGITFIDCESINEYEIFRQKISYAFSLQNIDDLVKYLKDNYEGESRLIILDNYESILNSSSNKTGLIKEQCNLLISKIAEYSTIIITSRELLCEPWEEEYTLRSLESDEALYLFNQVTKNKFSGKSSQRFIEVEILGNLLDRNALAIKLIASNLPSGVDFFELKKDLEENIFEMENNDIFNDHSDKNINRQQSILASILYSYKTLSVSEVKVLELVSFFPDGINLVNFKAIVKKYHEADKKNSINKIITDKDIKSLINKSLLENDSGLLKLQSIINRYANSTLSKSEYINSYCLEVVKYSIGLMNMIDESYIESESNLNFCIDMMLKNINNVMLSVDVGYDLIGRDLILDDYLKFLSNINFFVSIFDINAVYKPVIKKLILRARCDELSKESLRTIEMLYASVLYYNCEFKESLLLVNKYMPLNNIDDVNYDIYSNRLALQAVMSIYTMEGFNIEVIKWSIKNNHILDDRYNPIFVRIGFINHELLNVCRLEINTFEALSILGKDIETALNKEIKMLHQANHVQRLELMYARHIITPYSLSEVKKIVSVNIFTRGLKKLMIVHCLALNENLTFDDIVKIKDGYESALNDICNIKFFYIKALYAYMVFLKNINLHDEYVYIYNLGVELARKYSFRYLLYKFEIFNGCRIELFDYTDSSIFDGMDINGYIKNQYKLIIKKTSKKTRSVLTKIK